MQLAPQQLFSQLEKAHAQSTFQPIYFFFGEEPFLVHQAAQYLRSLVLDGVPRDFNERTDIAPEIDMDEIRAEIETLPMLAPRRWIWLQEAQDVPDKSWAQMEGLLDQPVSTSVWLITAQKIDKRKKFFKKLLDVSVHVEFRKPFENQLPSWILQIAKGHGLKLSDEALQLFHRLAGTSLREIDAELRKLKEYAAGRSILEIEDIASSVSRSLESNVFELIELMVKGKKAESLVALADLLSAGQSELGMVALLARHLRLLLRLKEGEKQGMTGQKLASFAQVPHYFLPQYLQQSALWTEKKLHQALLLTSETEKAIKSAPLSTHIWLENWIVKAGQILQPDLSRIHSWT